MTTYIEFSANRKAQIAHVRNRLMTVKPHRDEAYGTKYKRLFLADFAVYAALRGADYRKADHTGGKEATVALRRVINDIVYWGTSTSSFGKQLHTRQLRARFMPEDQTDRDLMDIKTILEEALEKWK